MRAINAATDRKNALVRRWILIIGTIVVFVMTYFSGMRASSRFAKAANEERKKVQEDFNQSQRVSRLRLANVTQLEARRQIALALSEVDKRNFGTAQERVAEAVRLLKQAQEADTANPDLSAPLQALEKTTVVAASDVAVQRDNLLAIAAQLDTLLTPYESKFIADGKADDDAHPIKKPTLNDVPALPGNDVTRTQ